MKKYICWKSAENLLLILAQLTFLLYPALVNGYPLLYSDSASYIVSGFEGNVPIDRPIVYGIFVKLFSLSVSLWPVIIVQALIIISLSYLTFSLFTTSKHSLFFSFITIFLLSALTGLPNYVSQCMPDIFTGIMIWSVILLFISTKQKVTVFLSSLIIFSSLVHFSNLLTLSILATILVLIVWLIKKWGSCRLISLRLLLLIGISWILQPTINFVFTKEFFISKSGNVFLMARLVETGIAKDYLIENCSNKNYSLCNSIDKLPEHAWQFLWNNDSPLYEDNCSENGGWSNCWVEKQQEYGDVIKDILLTPKYMKRLIKVSFFDFIKQLTDFDIGHLTKQGENSGFDPIIKKYFDDHFMYTQSKQYNKDLFFETESKIQKMAIFISLIVIVISGLWTILSGNRISKSIIMFVFIIVVGLLINAANCSFFASVLNRYQGRLIWLLPLIVLLFFFVFYDNRINRKCKA